ncbi:MAG: hypothetical protein CVU27_01405 [Betaproteobacteria bacterium HGW-Betaproteobacteria-20]|jgi:uncharacterized protein (DUF427 family)|nr:MAG: hypothetical protein CVU27_01405 [Betaproteobacteria bacterium HGW-Betaproteobacteria-20]
MKAVWNGAVIAESNDTVLLEGNHYFPFDSINLAFLRESTHTSTCGWKGLANYYSIDVNGKVNTNAVWIYRDPKTAAAEIKGHVAFWNGVTVTE